MILNKGLEAVMDLAGGLANYSAFTYLMVGTSTTAAAAADTALGAETTTAGLARVSVTPTLATTTTTSDTLQLTNTFTVTGSVTVGEVGVGNEAAAGQLLIRSVLSPTKALTSGDSYALTIQHIQARA